MSILFLLAGLGVVNGIAVALFLLIRKGKTISDVYFAGLLFALSLRIGKSIFFYFYQEVDLLILQIGLSACIFIGPFFYLYTQSLRKTDNHFRSKDRGLLLVLFIIIIAVGVYFPYRQFPEIWNGYVIYGIYAIWLFFIILGIYNVYYLIKPGLHTDSRLKPNEQYILATSKL